MRKKMTFALPIFVLMLIISWLPMNVIAKSKPKISKTKATMVVGETMNLKVKGLSKSHRKKVKWKSSNKEVVSVSKKGKLTAKRAGKAMITAKVSKKTLRCKVNVKSKRENKDNTPYDGGAANPVTPNVPDSTTPNGSTSANPDGSTATNSNGSTSSDVVTVDGVEFDMELFPQTADVELYEFHPETGGSTTLCIVPKQDINPEDITYVIADGNAELLSDPTTENLYLDSYTLFQYSYYVPNWENRVAYIKTYYSPDIVYKYGVSIYTEINKGSFNVSVYYKNNLIRTCRVNMNCVSQDKLHEKEVFDKIQRNAYKDGMTPEEKLSAIEKYVYDNYVYEDGYWCNFGAMALLYAARDMGLTARYRFVGPDYDYVKGYGDVYYASGSATCGGHVCTVITINGKDKYYETQGHHVKK